ncbi:response regulator transcription factor [Nonomuraea terrae]|uniref:Response regulator transcription factor n=1 Tax=Nonomuraea terrae TaxID=2530383 RepID=A0A4R4XU68_9ACTN|nr:response regulator [Nonomuraea terrae]TDD34519.1 response regulator transcription factor [Nonomuraea terrae]
MDAAVVRVVDDEPNIAELLTDALEVSGFRVRTAASGTRAPEHVGRDRPDIVLLDVMLPDLDGFAVAQRLRPDPRPEGEVPRRPAGDVITGLGRPRRWPR